MGLFLTLASWCGGKLSAIWRILSRLTLWQAVSLALACLSLWLYVGKAHETHRADKAEAQVAKHIAAEKAAAAEAKRREANANQITSQLRRENNEANRRIAADADALRMHGPGQARCIARVPQRPASPATPLQPSAPPGTEVPSGDWIAVPFDFFANVLEDHDKLLSYSGKDQEWHRQQEANR